MMKLDKRSLFRLLRLFKLWRLLKSGGCQKKRYSLSQRNNQLKGSWKMFKLNQTCLKNRSCVVNLVKGR